MPNAYESSEPALLGQRVVLRGLSARPELNGQRGLAQSFEGGRYVVALEDGGESVKVRPDDLSAVAANLFLEVQGYEPLAPPAEEYPYYPYSKFAATNGEEWEAWVEQNYPDLPGNEVLTKMRNFDTIQKAIYPLLSDQGMDKNAFLSSLKHEIEEMDDGEVETVFTVLSMRERKHAYNIYLLKKKVHDAWKKEREARSPLGALRHELQVAEEGLHQANAEEVKSKEAYFHMAGLGAALLSGAGTVLAGASYFLSNPGPVGATSLIAAGVGYQLAQEDGWGLFSSAGYVAANLAAAVTGVDDEKSNFEVSKQLTVQARGRKRRFEHELHEAEGKHATCKRQLLLAIDEDVQRGGKLNAT